MSNVYSFLDVYAAIAGPGAAISVGSGSGVAEEGIEIEYLNDIGGMQIGADGYGQHALYTDKSGIIRIRLMKTSPTNFLLSAAYAFQTSAGANYGQNTITITDKSRGDLVTAQQVGFAKYPNNTYAKDPGMLEWTFNALRITTTLGR